ncbi:hypothetical protein [Mesorhizobium sp. INR15]|uniref:hypothetical protein n=1 Tax=Mesorhizobium sp. INR15 TaxID=2654248 RepID=UPI0018968C9B|nr:hypothetical protein [Mesorhizobium sp. INR15]QPC91498.1 hypothetical protein GA829_13240 [Mesorhizobium sp. INR15]
MKAVGRRRSRGIYPSYRGDEKRARRDRANRAEARRQLAECNTIVERSGIPFEQVKGRFGCLANA